MKNKFLSKAVKKSSTSFKKMFSKKNAPKVMLLIGILIILFIVRKKFLMKEGFESTSSTFGTDIKDGKKLVLFYADWCGHCKKFKPIWDDMSNQSNKDGKNKLLKIDLGGDDPKNTSIMEKYKVDGFPTVALLNNGKLEETYNGERSKEALSNFISKKI